MNKDIFQKNVAILSKVSEQEEMLMPECTAELPSVDELHEMMELIKMIIFPGFFDRRQRDANVRSYHIGVNMERLLAILQRQIRLAFVSSGESECEITQLLSKHTALRFIDGLPEIKRMLYTDVDAIYDDDPSVRNHNEVIFCFPVITAMLHYRVAHALLELEVPVIPRIITEDAHAKTGIEIHPGAQIGEYFSIVHGTGVVIGETSIIGNHVTLYKGVTFGSKNFKSENADTHAAHHAKKPVPRHPIIEDNVTIYSNSTLLGRITIGHGTIIGGNIWLTHSVPPNSKIVQGKEVDVTFTDGLGI